MRHIADSHQQFFRAPYNQFAQLAYFLQPSKSSPQHGAVQPLIHAVFGSLDLLLYGVPKLISSIDIVNKVFRWVDFGAILEDLKLTPDQFVDACLIAGGDFLPTSPMLSGGSNQRFSFKAAVDLITAHGSAFAAIDAWSTVPSESQSYRDQFLRVKASIAHHIIFDMSGQCEPRNRDNAPADLHDVVGPRLPDDVMYLVCQGCLSTQVLTVLLSGGSLDLHPLVDSDELKQLILELAPLRSKTLGLLTFSLSDHFRRKTIHSLNYFDPGNKAVVAHFDTHADVASMRCLVSEEEISDELGRQGYRRRREVTVNLLLRMQQSRADASVSGFRRLAEGEPDTVTGSLSMAAAVYLQALEARDFLSQATRYPTVWGRALGSISGPFDEQAWVFLELLRAKALHGRALVSVVGVAPPNEQEVALLSRVFSLLPLRTTQKAWSGPVDHDLMAFNSIVKVMYKSLRNLEEMLLVNLVLSRRALCEPNELIFPAFKFPFAQETNSLLGVVLKSYFSPDQDFASVLQHTADAHLALDRGVLFWEQVMRMVNILNEENAIDSTTFELFESADDLLQQNKVALTNM